MGGLMESNWVELKEKTKVALTGQMLVALTVF